MLSIKKGPAALTCPGHPPKWRTNDGCGPPRWRRFLACQPRTVRFSGSALATFLSLPAPSSSCHGPRKSQLSVTSPLQVAAQPAKQWKATRTYQLFDRWEWNWSTTTAKSGALALRRAIRFRSRFYMCRHGRGTWARNIASENWAPRWREKAWGRIRFPVLTATGGRRCWLEVVFLPSRIGSSSWGEWRSVPAWSWEMMLLATFRYQEWDYRGQGLCFVLEQGLCEKLVRIVSIHFGRSWKWIKHAYSYVLSHSVTSSCPVPTGFGVSVGHVASRFLIFWLFIHVVWIVQTFLNTRVRKIQVGTKILLPPSGA